MAGAAPFPAAAGWACRIDARDPSGRAVVSLHGEHDISTIRELADTLARVIGVDDADVIVDLSDVAFIDGSTLDVLVGARNFLRLRRRDLALRAPSPCAQRMLKICDLTDLIDPGQGQSPPVASGALASWVAVPTLARRDEPAVVRRGEPPARPPPSVDPAQEEGAALGGGEPR